MTKSEREVIEKVLGILEKETEYLVGKNIYPMDLWRAHGLLEGLISRDDTEEE